MWLFSDCRQIVKYSGTSIEIASVKGPIQVPIKVAGVNIKPQLIQLAGQMLQILDWLQFTGCQRIHQLRKLKDIPQQTISDLILRQDENAQMIAYVAIISLTYCNSPENFEKVLADWIAAALPKISKLDKDKKMVDLDSEKNKLIEKTEESRNKIKIVENEAEKIEEEIFHIERNIKDLTEKLKSIKSKRDKLMDEKKDVIDLLDIGTMRIEELNIIYNTKNELDKKISEAISVYLYLSQTISKKKKFDIEKNLKKLSDVV